MLHEIFPPTKVRTEILSTKNIFNHDARMPGSHSLVLVSAPHPSVIAIIFFLQLRTQSTLVSSSDGGPLVLLKSDYEPAFHKFLVNMLLR